MILITIKRNGLSKEVNTEKYSVNECLKIMRIYRNSGYTVEAREM